MKIGDRIKVNNWSFDEPVVGQVVGKGQKNSEEVIDYELENGETYWCYMDQILEVLK